MLLVSTLLWHLLSPCYVLTTLCEEPMTVLELLVLNTLVMLFVPFFRVLHFGMRKKARGTWVSSVPFLRGRAVLMIVLMREHLRCLTALVF